MKTHWQLQDFINTKFFVRDNNDTPIKYGTLTGYDTHHSGSSLPIVNIDGEECLCFSALLPYDENLDNMFKNMNPQEQWNFMLKMQHWNCSNSRKCHPRRS